MGYLEDNARYERILLPDLVRAFALLGITLVNVAYFAFPSDVTYHAGGLNSTFDHAAYFGVNAFFLFKSYTLFSFMFGVGLAHQMISAERRGAAFTPSYFRRLTGLVVLGILHVTFTFLGDILIFYGVLGALLYLFRNAGQKKLIVTGIFLVFLQVLVALGFSVSLYMAETYAPDQIKMITEQIEENTGAALATYSSGSFADIAAQRWLDWLNMIQFLLPLQGPGIFGFFLLGLAAVRADVHSNASAPLWSRSRNIYLPTGLLLSMAGALLYMTSENSVSSSTLLAYAVILLAAPLCSLGYIGLIAKWSDGQATATKVFLARSGTASLTAYLLQSVVLSLIFCGYGLGYYGKFSAFTCVVLAFAVGMSTITLLSLWRTRFKRGPVEILLRRWTYLT